MQQAMTGVIDQGFRRPSTHAATTRQFAPPTAAPAAAGLRSPLAAPRRRALTPCGVLTALHIATAAPPAAARTATATTTGAVAGKRVKFLQEATADDFAAALEGLRQAAVQPAPAADQHAPAASNGGGGFLGFRLFGGAPAPHAPASTGPPRRVLAMFTAEWCGPCSMVYKELKKAVELMPKEEHVTILVIDVEQNPALASELNIRGLPTLLYLGPNAGKGPITTQGAVVSSALIIDMLKNRVEAYAGHDLKAPWLKL